MIKHHSVIYTWVITYILLLVLIIFAGFSMEKLASRQLVEEYKEISDTLQEQVGESLQFYVEKMQNQAIEFCSDSLVTSFALSANPYGANYHSVISLQERLNNLMLSTENEIELYLYLNNIDKAISKYTVYEQENFYRHINTILNLDEDTFQNILSQQFHNTILAIETENGTEKTVVMLTSIPITGISGNGMFIQILDEKVLENILVSRTVLADSTLLLLDENNQVICSSGNGDIMDGASLEELSRISNSEYELNGENYWITWETLENENWKLMTVVPMRSISEKTSWVSKIMFSVLYIVLLVGILVSVCGVCMNYLPLRKLKRVYTGKALKTNSKNEFEQLESAFRGMHTELESIQVLQNMQAEQLRLEFLRFCLENSIDLDESSLLKIIENMGVKIPNGSFIAGIFAAQTEEDEQPLPSEKMMGIFSSFFAEGKFVEYGTCFVLCKNEVPVLLFYLYDSQKEEELRHLLKKGLQDLEKQQHWEVIYAFSALHRGFSEIHLAYLESCELMDYKQSRLDSRTQEREIEVEGLPRYGQIRYSAVQEELLMRYILAGNTEDALELLNIIYSHNFTEQMLSLSTAYCLMEYIVIGMMKALSAEGYLDENMMKKYNDVLDQMRKSNSQSVLRSFVNELVSETAEFCGQMKTQKKGTRELPVEKIMDCVDAHFREYDFNVSKAAEYLGMNMTYLSRFFKEHTGIGLLNYINGVRIGYAKQLLSYQKISVAEAARQAGFENQNTFIRLFKKFEGKTPGIFQGMGENE